MNKRIALYFMLITIGIITNRINANAKEAKIWEGDGTFSSPYLIESIEDLSTLRDSVNSGETYEDVYFRQTQDIYMTEPWIQIGIYDPDVEYVFRGTYDGYGHIIDGLNNGEDHDGYALFENFDGVIVNLGLTNVNIDAANAAAFVFCTKTSGHIYPTIINCYVTGTITGDDCAGIAVNFEGGEIVNCLDYTYMGGADSKGILHSFNNTQIYHCISTNDVCVENIATSMSSSVGRDEFYNVAKNKSSIFFALSQILYGNRHGVELKKWFILPEESDGIKVLYTNDIGVVANVLFIINDFLMPLMLLGIISLLILKKGEISKRAVGAGLVISTVIVLFSDATALLIQHIDLSLGKILYLILINGLFVFFIIKVIQLQKIYLRKIINPIMLLLIIVIIGAALLQFDIVPRYDAALYYGSLVKSASLFNLDLFTFMGAFICWKWIHGIALLIEPFELIWQGQMVGLYIATLIIVLISFILLYKLLCGITNIDHKLCAAISAILIFCPYQMGLFAYFTLDNYLAYFVVWLIYAYWRRNDYLIAFFGFILIFTKDTALFFYVAFLVFATAASILMEHKKSFVKGVVNWWDWKRVILWITPAVLYLFKYKFGDYFSVQNFYGTSSTGLFEGRTIYSYLNTVFQSWVWGFRWAFLIVFIVAMGKLCFKGNIIREIINIDNIGIYVGVFAGMMAVFACLLAYQGDAECPRYTAILNIGFVLLLALSVQIIAYGNTMRVIIISSVFTLMFVQTYFTIDPTIIFTNQYLETGENRLYKLAFAEDKRPTMNIGMDYGRGYGCVGDVYAYNTQFNYYSYLLNDLFRDVPLVDGTMFNLLDVDRYELNIHGVYSVFWNPSIQKLEFKKNDGDFGIYMGYIISDDLINSDDYYLSDDFYLIIPYRVDYTDALNCMENRGFYIEEEKDYSNINGAIKVLHMKHNM